MAITGKDFFKCNAGGLTSALVLAAACCLALHANAADYFWQPVDGEWSGAWNDTAHWRSDAPGSSGYPSTSSDTASFSDCTLDNPVTVAVNGSYTCNTLRCFGTNASDIVFAGAGSESSGLKCTLESTDRTSANPPIASNTKIEFRDMTLTRTAPWLIVKNTAGIKNITVRFTRAVANANKAANYAFQLSAPYSRLELVDSDVTTAVFKLAGLDTVMLIDNSTFACTDFYVHPDVKDAAGTGNLQIILQGKGARMASTGANFPQHYNAGQKVRFIFRVPSKGYSKTPLVHSHASSTFAKGGTTKKDYVFEVAEDSPALKSGGLKNHVLVETSNGFNVNVIDEFSAPGRTTLAWGVDGTPLDSDADLSTARQVLLTIPPPPLLLLLH